MRVRYRIVLWGRDEDRSYYREVEIAWQPVKGVIIEFCDCCSGLAIERTTWIQEEVMLLVEMVKTEHKHAASYWHELFTHHWHFQENLSERGLSMGKSETSEKPDPDRPFAALAEQS